MGIGFGIGIEIGFGNGSGGPRVAFIVNHWLGHQRVKHSTPQMKIFFQFHATFAAEVLMSVEIAGHMPQNKKPTSHPGWKLA